MPSEAQMKTSEAEAGMGAMNQDTNQTMLGVDTQREKAMNGQSTVPEHTSQEQLSSSNSDAASDASPVPVEKKGPGAGAEPEKERSKLETALLMLALCLAVFLAALDMTIITTALPTISAHYHASQADYQWIGSAYLLAAAAGTPSWGKISDIFGRKPVILIANVIFFVGSLICAVSININMLLAGRVIQGIGGGGLIIMVNICIGDLFSIRSRGQYYGMVGGVWAIASALGPVLGGVFTEYVSWRWCFYINLPVDGLAFVILFIYLDIETPRTPILEGLAAIDWLGSLTVVGGTVMLLFGLEFGGVSHPWNSPIVLCLIIFGVLTIGLFLIIEWKVAKYPVMPLRIFKFRSNIAALGTCFCHGFVFISGSYYLPLYFQSVLGASPLLSGVYLFPFVLSLSFVSAGAGIIIKKTGQYLPLIWGGMLIMTLGFGLYIDLPTDKQWAKIIIFQIIAGIGVGPNFQSPLIALQSLVQPRDIATATATFGFTRNLATSISVVVGGVIFQNGMQKRAATLTKTLGPELAQKLGGGSAGANTDLIAGLTTAQKVVVDKAFTDSLREMWIFYAVIALVGFAVSLLISKQTLSKTHQKTETGLAAQEEGRRLEKAAKEEKRRSSAMLKREEVVNGNVNGSGEKVADGDVEKA
ncbi:hypothetical protein MMC25_004597 [Agyrium rufum]|nr:hypothetical protein [Agyrium rufum]